MKIFTIEEDEEEVPTRAPSLWSAELPPDQDKALWLVSAQEEVTAPPPLDPGPQTWTQVYPYKSHDQSLKPGHPGHGDGISRTRVS